MADKTGIQWTDSTWTPIRARVKEDAAAIATAKGYRSLVQIAGKMAGHTGPHCEHASPACDHCYSETNNGRCLPTNGTGLPFDRRSRDLVDVFVDQKILEQPLHWKRGRKIFVCSQTDLFGEFVTDEMIDQVFAVMALCPQHTFQVLTKRADRMREYFTVKRPRRWVEGNLSRTMPGYICRKLLAGFYGTSLAQRGWVDGQWPLPNVWLGVSVENQQYADERIPLLLQTPAAVRFLSVEPLLGPVDLASIPTGKGTGEEWDPIIHMNPLSRASVLAPHIHWVIVGGESGPGARPMAPDWVRSIRDQCEASGVPFFFKQFGAHNADLKRVGKKAAGRLLDGRTWDQMPEAKLRADA